MFNLSLTTCATPSSWKCARVTPLHKGGDPQDINNYPFQILIILQKYLKKIIFNQLSKYLNDYNILSPHQSDFLMTTALSKFSNDILSSFDNNISSGAIFIDLSKAFDMVDHYLLLVKLYAIVFSTQSLLFLNYFLFHRSQSVSFQSTHTSSPWEKVCLKAHPWVLLYFLFLLTIFPKSVPAIKFIFMLMIPYFTLLNLNFHRFSALYNLGSFKNGCYQTSFSWIRKKSHSMFFSIWSDWSLNFLDGEPLEFKLWI